MGTSLPRSLVCLDISFQICHPSKLILCCAVYQLSVRHLNSPCGCNTRCYISGLGTGSQPLVIGIGPHLPDMPHGSRLEIEVRLGVQALNYDMLESGYRLDSTPAGTLTEYGL